MDANENLNHTKIDIKLENIPKTSNDEQLITFFSLFGKINNFTRSLTKKSELRIEYTDQW